MQSNILHKHKGTEQILRLTACLLNSLGTSQTRHPLGDIFKVKEEYDYENYGI